jgi:WD40 repeat protein
MLRSAAAVAVLALAMAGCISEENVLTPAETLTNVISFKAGNKIVFSPDGKYLVAMKEWFNGQAENANASLFEVATGKLVRTFKYYFDADIFGAAFSPDGKMLAACGGEMYDRDTRTESRRVVIWDVATGARRYEIAVDGFTDMHAITFTPDGKSVVFFSQGKVWVWDYKKYRLNDSIPLDYPENELDMYFTPDGSKLLLSPFAMVDMTARKEIPLDLSNLNLTWKHVVFSGDGRNIFCCGRNSVVSIDAATLAVTGSMEEHESDEHNGFYDDLDYTAIDADRAGRYFVTGDDWGRVRVWRAGNGELVGSGEVGTIHCVRFSPDGESVAVAGDDDMVTIWHIQE